MLGWTSHTSLSIAINWLIELTRRTKCKNCSAIPRLQCCGSAWQDTNNWALAVGQSRVCSFVYILRVWIVFFLFVCLFNIPFLCLQTLSSSELWTADWRGSNGNLINFFTGWTPKLVLMCVNNTCHFNQDFFSTRQKEIYKRHQHTRTHAAVYCQ